MVGTVFLPVKFAANIVSSSVDSVLLTAGEEGRQLKYGLTNDEIGDLVNISKEYVERNTGVNKSEAYYAGLWNVVINGCPNNGRLLFGGAKFQKIKKLDNPSINSDPKTCKSDGN